MPLKSKMEPLFFFWYLGVKKFTESYSKNKGIYSYFKENLDKSQSTKTQKRSTNIEFIDIKESKLHKEEYKNSVNTFTQRKYFLFKVTILEHSKESKIDLDQILVASSVKLGVFYILNWIIVSFYIITTIIGIIRMFVYT